MGKRSYWLLKTEAGEWSWEDQRSNGGVSVWDGVRNRQAQNNMRAMRPGDRCFFYHSGPKDRRVVGVVEVVRAWYETEKDEGVVDVREVGEMKRHVHLGDIKKAEGEEVMKGFALLRQPRLSVVPVPEKVWERICEMGGGFGPEETAEEAATAEEEEEEQGRAVELWDSNYL